MIDSNSQVKVAYTPYRLKFKQPGGTSRGVLTEKLTFFIRLETSEGQIGYGEIPIFPGLSAETVSDLEEVLKSFTGCHEIGWLFENARYSSVIFGLEEAFRSLQSSENMVFPSVFTEGKESIPINGLIWMGDFSEMMSRVEEKLSLGFTCLKLKIGAIDWKQELELIERVRYMGGPQLTLRLDANGAFNSSDCLRKLEQLAQYDIHSIEQPIRSGQWEEMREICQKSPIPIALDEELIGLPPGERRNMLLESIKPQYIILKPALCFGFSGAMDWIERAESRGIGWWITSALESSVGLNAIAQFTGELRPKMPQGLGTGSLFSNNFSSPISLINDELRFTGPSDIYYTELEKLKWETE